MNCSAKSAQPRLRWYQQRQYYKDLHQHRCRQLYERRISMQISNRKVGSGLQIRNANSHDCEKLRSEANSLRIASHKIDLTSLRFRFAIFKTRSLSLRFRNWNRLRIRRAKFAKNSLFGEHFSRFLRAQFQSSVIFKLEYSFENNNLLR